MHVAYIPVANSDVCVLILNEYLQKPVILLLSGMHVYNETHKAHQKYFSGKKTNIVEVINIEGYTLIFIKRNYRHRLIYPV